MNAQPATFTRPRLLDEPPGDPQGRFFNAPDYEVYSLAGVLYTRTKDLGYARLTAAAAKRDGVETRIVRFSSGPEGAAEIAWVAK